MYRLSKKDNNDICVTMMNSLNDIRDKFLDYFEKNGHERLDSSPLVPHNDPTLMFTNAGMVPFKNVFSGQEPIKNRAKNNIKRATTSQKCVRAGGKHNDLDNVGYTTRHHTFFEMLGNFSFGDYFKDNAIKFAWEFLTIEMKVPHEKLFVTVYHTDDEAFNIWKEVTGFPDEKILRIPTSDNFWAMGDTGPCGPCSEIFYDHGVGNGEWKLDKDGYDLFDERYVEIWNLVFMQFEKLADGTKIDLPKPCIDTGMGLERMAAVMQNVHDNYDIDLFKNLIADIKDISNTDSLEHNSSYRIIADHLRSCSFLLADGVMPSNEGRGYVLRRIMRRAMRHAHILGCREPLMYKLVPSLIKEMGKAYPELIRAESLIIETLKLEEERFKETLEKGLSLLEEETTDIKKGDKLDGRIAFKLYDTYGFPLDLTQDILRGQNIAVDLEAYEKAMEEQKAKSRAATFSSGEVSTDDIWFGIKETCGATEFIGYNTLEGSGQVVAIIKDGEQTDIATKGDKISILTNQTPFYGESGGQAGDRGTLSNQSVKIEINDTKKILGSLHVHIGTIISGNISIDEIVSMKVDKKRRDSIRANHSATHLLHAALRNTLGNHVTQKGSLVEGDYFRFDFNHNKGVTSDEAEQIEASVNKIINQNATISTKLMTPDEAIEQGATALFGEKYGDEVRVVTMGNSDNDKSYSVELCGGIHVHKTSDIGLFKIAKEGSVASGIRRIEGRTGKLAEEFIEQQKNDKLEAEQRKKASEVAKASVEKAVGNIREQFIAGLESAEQIGDITFHGFTQDGIAPKDLRGLVDEFKKKVESGIVVIIAVNDGKASIVVGVTDNLTNRYNAVDLVRAGAEALGGKGGGGRPDFAQAGGSNPSKSNDAIEVVKKFIS